MNRSIDSSVDSAESMTDIRTNQARLHCPGTKQAGAIGWIESIYESDDRFKHGKDVTTNGL